VLRTGATLAVRSLLALLAVCCCVASTLAQEGKTYWQVDGGGGAGTRAVMTLEGGSLRFVKSRIEFEMSRIPDGTEYFSGQRSGNTIKGFFTHNLLKGTNCAPAYSGFLDLSPDGLRFTLTATAIMEAAEKREPDYRDGICERVDMPTCRGWKPPKPAMERWRRDCNGVSAFKPADVTRGVQIHWPSKELVVAVAPPAIARVPDAVPPAKTVEKLARAAPPLSPQSNTLAVTPERTDPMFAVLLVGGVVVCWLVFRNGNARGFLFGMLRRLARWLAITAAVAAAMLAPIYWLGQNRELIATEGTFFHWMHYNVSVPVGTALNRAAPYCGTALLSSPAGANPAYPTFENVLAPPHWPRCQASLAALAVSVHGWSGWSASGQWLSGVWQWLSTNSGGVLPWFGWLFGTIWAWVSAPFVWVFSSISDALWWLATPFVQFFWLVYTIIYWLLWLVVQIVIWFVWIVWTLAVWLVWLLGQALYYLALALKWFAINLGNYVIAIGLVAGAFFALAMRGDNPLSEWVKDYVARHKPQPSAQQHSNNQHKPNTPPPPDNRLAEYMNALDVLGVKDKVGFLKEDDVRARYRQLSKQTHPDHGGSSRMQADVNAAWLVVCAKHGWRK